MLVEQRQTPPPPKILTRFHFGFGPARGELITVLIGPKLLNIIIGDRWCT